MNEEKILEKLVCKDIPNTRKLQEIRLKSVGSESCYEEFMRQHYREKWENNPRLIKIPDDELAKVYSLAIPLTFPLLDWTGHSREPAINTSFWRWHGPSSGTGAMHLTTKKGINELIKIFVKNSIPITLETSYSKVFDTAREHSPAVSVPHSWYEETYDGGQCLFTHQFVACEHKVSAVPYWILEELTFKKEKEEDKSANISYISISHSKEQSREFRCHATFFIPKTDYYFLPEQPKDYLPLKLAEEAKKSIGKVNYQGRVIKSSKKLLKIGEPVEIYDPK